MITAADLNAKLLSAIRAERINDIKELINKGADPLGIIKIDNDETGIPDYVQPFINAVLFRSADILDVILESALQKYRTTNVNILDLGRRVVDNKDASNLLQAICVNRPEPEYLKRIVLYAKKTNQNIEELLNAPFPMFKARLMGGGSEIKYEISLAERLATDLSIRSINTNFYLLEGKSFEFTAKVKELWHDWYNNNGEESSAIGCHLLAKGPLDTIKCLVEYGLDIRPIATLLPQLIEYTSDLSHIQDFFNTMLMEQGNITFDSETPPKLDDKNRLQIRVIAINKFNKHPSKLMLHIDFSELNEFVQNTLQKQKELAPFNVFAASMQEDMETTKARIASLNTKVEILTKDMQELKKAFSNLAETQKTVYRRELKDDEIALQLFDYLESNTKSQLEGSKMATLKLFNPKPTSKMMEYAGATISVLNFATNGIPGATNVLSAINFCRKKYAEIQTKRHYENISEKILGVDAPIVAINVAGHIARRYLSVKGMLDSTYNNTKWLNKHMWKQVYEAIDSLANMKESFVSIDHLVAYLCTNAIQRLGNAELYKVGVFDNNNVHNLRHPHSPRFMPGYAASSNVLSTSTVAMNEVYAQVSSDHQQSSSSFDSTQPLVFSSGGGKKTPSPKTQNSAATINNSDSGDSSNHSRNYKRKKTPSKCTIM